MNFAILSLVLALLVFGLKPCDKRGVSLNQEFEIKTGQEVAVGGEGLKIRFDSVVEDSRCPIGVECIWEGNAKLAVTLQKVKGKPASVELNTAVEPKRHSYMGYEVRLVALRPHPKVDTTINKNDYVATLSVSKQ